MRILNVVVIKYKIRYEIYICFVHNILVFFCEIWTILCRHFYCKSFPYFIWNISPKFRIISRNFERWFRDIPKSVTHHIKEEKKKKSCLELRIRWPRRHLSLVLLLQCVPRKGLESRVVTLHNIYTTYLSLFRDTHCRKQKIKRYF